MNEIQDTKAFVKDGGAYLLLADAMGGKSSSDIITDMEAAGQRQLVASQQLPTKIQSGMVADFEALGFTFGEPLKDDPMFRPATLPPGWTKRGTDHDMWSRIDDELGRERVSIFYKAAFYDRSAFMRLVTVEGYVSQCQYAGATPVADETWATPASIVEAALQAAQREAEEAATWQRHADEGYLPEESKKYAAEHTARREAFLAIARHHGGAVDV